MVMRVMAALMLSAGLAACASGPAEKGQEDGATVPWQAEGDWQVVEIAGQPVAEGMEVTLVFMEEGRVAGRAACNRYNGAVSQSGDSLQFSQMASTRMACPAPLMETEYRYLTLLQEVVGYQLPQADTLILKAADGGQIVARR